MYKEVLARPAGPFGWLQFQLTWPPAQAVIIYFDSDAADVDESKFDLNDLRARYVWNLTEVVKTISKNVPLVALSGPTLCGELPRGTNGDDAKFEEYCAMNRRICTNYNVTYLETRELFFANLPGKWNHSHGYLTLDGEHHNERGSSLVEDLFFDVIENDWGKSLFPKN